MWGTKCDKTWTQNRWLVKPRQGVWGMCSSIVPYIPHTRDISVINITPSREDVANDVYTVIDANDTLTAATSGGGKTCLMVGVATKIRKRGNRVLFVVPMHIHNDTIITTRKLLNTEIKHKVDVCKLAFWIRYSWCFSNNVYGGWCCYYGRSRSVKYGLHPCDCDAETAFEVRNVGKMWQ